MSATTETRTYLGEIGTQVFDSFMGMLLNQRYTGVVQDDGRVLVSTVGASVGSGVKMTQEEWAK